MPAELRKQQRSPLTREGLQTPGAAAIAGILFGLKTEIDLQARFRHHHVSVNSHGKAREGRNSYVTIPTR